MKYHLTALLTVTIWSITYISSKIVLEVLNPTQLTMYRFVIGYICLIILKRPSFKGFSLKKDKDIILSAFFGIFLYYIVENYSTNYTQASYVSIIVSVIPLITSLFAHFINKDEKFTFLQIVTFIMAFAGVVLIMIEGTTLEGGYLLGNILALVGSVIFSFYNIFLKRIDPNIDPLEKARKLNFYGLAFIALLFIFVGDKNIPVELIEPKYLFNLIFLGVIASSMCILLWGYSITGIGAISASRYIYLAPLITSVVSSFILKESLTLHKILGICLILLGVSFPNLISKLPKLTVKKPYKI